MSGPKKIANEPGYPTRSVVRMTGIPYSTLNLWAKKGFFRPSISPGRGTGNERMYSQSDLEYLRVAYSLRGAGLNPKLVSKVISALHSSFGARVKLTLCAAPRTELIVERTAK